MTKLAPFLVSDLPALKRKIAGFTGAWASRWQHFLAKAGEERRSILWYGSKSTDTPLHAALAYLVTGERHWGEVARRDIEWMLNQYPATLAEGAQDLDTWIYAAAMARRAIAADWLWDSGMFSKAELDRIAEHFITDSLKYPYVVLHHRVPPHANNQGLAQALNLVVVGFIFGSRRGDDPRARHLLEVGIAHMHQQTAYLPPGGYSGEGSTYVVNVADPLMALGTAVMSAITGADYLDKAFAPNANSARKILQLNARLVPPSAILPGWDQHGFQLQKAGTTACFLSHATGDPSYAYHFLFGNGWEFAGHFAWLADDHVWMLLWLPDPLDVPEPREGTKCYPKSWAERRVAGGLIDSKACFHLFQMWDLSSGRPIRTHMNPNSILLEAWESLLTVDGNAIDHIFPLARDSRMQYLHQYAKEPTMLSWAAGSLGAHSCITVDGVIEHTHAGGGFHNLPGTVVTGVLRRLEVGSAVQVLATEVAPFYRNRFDVTSMIRSSALIDERLWFIHDAIESDSPHEYTWQLVLRQGAVLTDYGARLLTAERVVLDIVALDGAAFSLKDIAGYPSTLEGKCHHLQRSTHGKNQEFSTVLIPRLARMELANWTNTWSKKWDGEGVSETVAGHEQDFSAWDSGELTDAYFRSSIYTAGAPDPTVIWFARACQIPLAASKHSTLFLELPRATEIELWIDGIKVNVPELSPYHEDATRLMPPFIEVTSHLRNKVSARLVLRISKQGTRGIAGEVRLHGGLALEAPQVSVIDDLVSVSFDGRSHSFNLSHVRTAAAPLEDEVEAGLDPIQEAETAIRSLVFTNVPDQGSWQGSASERGKACGNARLKTSDEVEDELIRFTHDSDWGVQLMAIRSLGLVRSKKAVLRLRSILREESPAKIKQPNYQPKYRLKEMALIALGEIGDRSAVPEIAEVLVEGEFYGARRIAADLLGNLGETSVIPHLDKWTNDSDWETASAARRSIARLKSQVARG